MKQDDFKKEWTLQEFKNHVWDRIGKTTDQYPLWLLKEFCEYWGHKPGGRNKMQWQLKGYNKSGEFFISMRLASWKTRSMEWHPKRWIEKKPQAPVKWSPINQSPEALEEERLIREAYERQRNNPQPRIPYQPKTIVKMKLEEVRRQADYAKRAEKREGDL